MFMTQTVTPDEGTVASSRSEFRRGWPTLVFSTIGAGVGLSALGYILGTLVVPLQEEFGWGRGEIKGDEPLGHERRPRVGRRDLGELGRRLRGDSGQGLLELREDLLRRRRRRPLSRWRGLLGGG